MALFTLHQSTETQDTAELSTDCLRGIIHSASKVRVHHLQLGTSPQFSSRARDKIIMLKFLNL